MSIIQDPDLVVAIDVGSTHSGYAWKWKSETVVEFNTNWGLGAPEIHKTSSKLLLKYEDKQESDAPKPLPIVEGFGHEAERRHAIIKSDRKTDEATMNKYQLFDRFKMQIYHVQEHLMLNDDTMTESTEHFAEKLKTVLALFIKALRDHFVTKHDIGQTVLDKTVWAVTVPALWSEAAKAFVKDAAIQAGIEKNKLLLATEPECAAVYCINLSDEQRRAMEGLGNPGTSFLTVDVGGGTADLSAVHVEDDGTLTELCLSKGSNVGGQSVNDAFIQACYDSLEVNVNHTY